MKASPVCEERDPSEVFTHCHKRMNSYGDLVAIIKRGKAARLRITDGVDAHTFRAGMYKLVAKHGLRVQSRRDHDDRKYIWVFPAKPVKRAKK